MGEMLINERVKIYFRANFIKLHDNMIIQFWHDLHNFLLSRLLDVENGILGLPSMYRSFLMELKAVKVGWIVE